MEGSASPSQYTRRTSRRQKVGLQVIQMCWRVPGPSISARVTVVRAGMWIEGDTFQPWPNSRDESAPVPVVAWPAWPLAPVKFSALIERV